MLHIILHRQRIGEEVCDGEFTVCGKHICHTAEPTPFCAPAGTYPLEFVYNPALGKKAPSIVLPDKRLISIAVGNGAYHARNALILVGTFVAPGCLVHSHAAYKRFFHRALSAMRRGSDVWLTVRE